MTVEELEAIPPGLGRRRRIGGPDSRPRLRLPKPLRVVSPARWGRGPLGRVAGRKGSHETMLARLPFRSKLLLVASIPLLVLMLFVGIALRDAYESISAADDDASLFVPFRALTQLAQASTDERIGAAWYAHIPDDGPAASDALMLNTRDATDVAVDRLTVATTELDGRASTEAMGLVQTVLRNIEGLDTARVRVNLHQNPGGVFQQISESAIAAADLVLRDFNDPELAAGARAVLDLQREQLALGNEARIVIERLAGGTSGDLAEWVAAITEQSTQRAQFAEGTNAEQRAAFAATESGAARSRPGPRRRRRRAPHGAAGRGLDRPRAVRRLVSRPRGGIGCGDRRGRGVGRRLLRR